MYRAHKKLVKLFSGTLLVFLCFLFVNLNIIYADPASPSDLNRGLSDSEITEIEDYKDLEEMISEIFELSSDRGTEELSDPIKLMYSLLGRLLKYYEEEFVGSSLYKFVVGLGFIILMSNFIVKMYEEMSAGIGIKFNSNEMVRKYILLIFAMLLLFNLKNIVYFILGFFRFILKLAINTTEANFLGEPEEIDNILNPSRVAYEILKQNGIVKSDTLLDEVIVRSKESAVRTSFMIPWVFSWISKMALLVVIFLNSIKLLVHCIFYVVSVGDFFKDVKRSKFIEYTKILIALALEETVIIVVLYISNMLLNPYLKGLLEDGINNGVSFLTLAMIFTGVQMARVIAIISCNAMAKRIIGVA